MSLAKDGKLSAFWEATQSSFFSHLLSTFVLVFAFIFNFIFVVCFDVFCCFSISSLGAKGKRTSKKEIQPQNNSTNEEKNSIDTNSC